MVANLSDLNKAVVTSSDGNLNDGNHAYFGGVSPNTLNTVMLASLKGNSSYTGNNLNTAWAVYFAEFAPGLQGTLQDKQKEFLLRLLKYSMETGQELDH